MHSYERRWLVLSVLCIAVFLVVVDNTIVNVALPTLSRELHATNSSLQWIVDGYSLPFAGLLIAGGGLSDRVGRKLVMQFALVMFGLFSLLAALSHNIETLLTARALMGAAAAFIFPATLSTLTEVFDDTSERAKAFGVWGATTGIAIALGPIAGGVLIDHFWYGSIFLVNVPLVIVGIVAIAWVVPESRSPQRRRLDLLGLFFGTSGVTALVLAIIEGPAWGWRSFQTLILFVVAAIVLYVFALVELRRVGPLLDVRIFHNRTFSAGAGAIATNFFCLFGFIFLVTQYFQFVRGYSALSTGVHTLPFAFGVMVTTPLGALAALRLGTRYVVALGLVITGIGLFWMSTLSANASYFGPIVGSMITLAIGFSMVNAPSVAATMETLAPSRTGRHHGGRGHRIGLLLVVRSGDSSRLGALSRQRALGDSVGWSSGFDASGPSDGGAFAGRFAFVAQCQGHRCIHEWPAPRLSCGGSGRGRGWRRGLLPSPVTESPLIDGSDFRALTPVRIRCH
jgi:DHA2 family multidrug resistance protein-like MFS transporter